MQTAGRTAVMVLALSAVATSTKRTRKHSSHRPPLAFTSNANHASLSLNDRRMDVPQSLPAMSSQQEFMSGPSSPSQASAPPTPSCTSTTLTALIDSQKEFEMNLGRAVDILKDDYPKLLVGDPDWSIYHEKLEVVDPSGVSLHGLGNYKRAFSFIHTLVNWFYCEEKSGLTSIRVGYDWARKVIRISWNVELIPKLIYGGESAALHVDGISEYFLDRSSGLITEHKVSHLLINDQAVRPTNGIFTALAEISPEGEGVPVFFGYESNSMTNVKFQTWNPVANFIKGRQSTSLFSANGSSGGMDAYTQPMQELSNEPAAYDEDAFQRKNLSRKKFGVPPLTPEEFMKIEGQIREMDAMNKKTAAFIAEEAMRARKNSEKKENFLGSLFGGVLKNGCESNFDCERPEVCCDIGFKKMCCSNGLGIVDGMPVEKYQRATLRVPLPNDNVDY